MSTSSSKTSTQKPVFIGAAKPKDFTPDFDLASAFDEIIPDKKKVEASASTSEVEKAAIKQADDAAAATKAKAPAKAKKAPVVRDFSTDKPNRPAEEYRAPKEGRSFVGGSKSITKRDSGINRFAVLIARPGGCTEVEGRHVNPRGFEYSGGFGSYVAQNTGMTILVKDGRYQVASKNSSGEIVVDEESRKAYFDALGGQPYLDQVVNSIRGNLKYDYSGFELSNEMVAA